MTIAIILNILFCLIVLSVIIGLKVWAVHTGRPAAAAPVPANNPRVHEHAAYADRARATGRHAAPVGAQA